MTMSPFEARAWVRLQRQGWFLGVGGLDGGGHVSNAPGNAVREEALG